MNLVDELQKLQDLHRAGALTDREFTAAKSALIAQGNSGTDQKMQIQLQKISLQNELAELERSWMIDREQYMVAFPYRHRTIPSRWMGAFSCIVAAGFGTVWTGLAISRGAPTFFPIFGVIFITFGVVMGLYTFNKASEYDQALREYQQRRAEIMREIDQLMGR